MPNRPEKKIKDEVKVIKLKRRTPQEQREYLLNKGLAESGAVTRSCLVSMGLLLDEAHQEIARLKREIERLKDGV